MRRLYGRPRSLRQRLTLLSTLLVSLALIVGVVVLAQVLNRALTSQLRSEVQAQCASVAGTLRAGEGLDSLEPPPGLRVQVLTGDRVIYASWAAGHDAALSTARPAPGRSVTVGGRAWWTPSSDEPPLLVRTESIEAGAPYTIIVAASQSHIERLVTQTVVSLLIATPFLVAALSLFTWWLVGRSLRPIEAIRSQVETITAARLHDVVPVPDTGDEVAALAGTMNDMLVRLRAAQEAQRRFVSDASHELRSPLTSLVGALQIARNGRGANVWEEFGPMLSAEADRLQSVVNGLILLSSIDDHGLALEQEDVDLDDIAQGEARRLAHLGRVTVVTRITPVRLIGDEKRLSQVVRNLVDNAARHARSTVLVEVGTQGSQAVLSVDDDGTGIPEADRLRVFDRFVRLDESRARDAGGSGLGLAIVAEIVRGHHGVIRAEQSALGGARMLVHLPLAEPASGTVQRSTP